jgi:hypothetical protein
MGDHITISTDGLEPSQVAEILELVQQHRERNAVNQIEDDESWRTAKSTGWTMKHVDLLLDHLRSHPKWKVQIESFEAAVKNGGFSSREQVYALGGYEPARKLNNWTAPFNNYWHTLVEHHGLPESADWAVETNYGPGSGYRPAIGFDVAPEIVKLLRS